MKKDLPILKSSIKSWNCPWMSPQTVTGHLTAYTLLSFDKISLAYILKVELVFIGWIKL